MSHKYSNYNHYHAQSSIHFISACWNAVFDYKQLSSNSKPTAVATRSNAKNVKQRKQHFMQWVSTYKNTLRNDHEDAV